ncbi:uncharacterized protein LY79DRAFT_552677 [Colletotrichum navitas]|uniref:Uncharacterized protein n=1 Tax=Colletotrichum navitas TaxID=681940 RepID=A0AAD8Q0S7_9PEZI|nr:uncharacterized protein LY79DRAFT_552677 [Colletotrichum navitas]KAK1593379.1 hypothetical protein LY79DRAFT_552677 [Colletotrichum navitas]
MRVVNIALNDRRWRPWTGLRAQHTSLNTTKLQSLLQFIKKGLISQSSAGSFPVGPWSYEGISCTCAVFQLVRLRRVSRLTRRDMVRNLTAGIS